MLCLHRPKERSRDPTSGCKIALFEPALWRRYQPWKRFGLSSRMKYTATTTTKSTPPPKRFPTSASNERNTRATAFSAHSPCPSHIHLPKTSFACVKPGSLMDIDGSRCSTTRSKCQEWISAKKSKSTWFRTVLVQREMDKCPFRIRHYSEHGSATSLLTRSACRLVPGSVSGEPHRVCACARQRWQALDLQACRWASHSRWRCAGALDYSTLQTC